MAAGAGRCGRARDARRPLQPDRPAQPAAPPAGGRPRPAGCCGGGSPVRRAALGDSRWGTRGLSLLMRSGVGGAVLRKRVVVRPSSAANTDRVLPLEQLQQELRISMYLGAARANRKPVLQLFTPTGDPVGVAKIGVSPRWPRTGACRARRSQRHRSTPGAGAARARGAALRHLARHAGHGAGRAADEARRRR